MKQSHLILLVLTLAATPCLAQGGKEVNLAVGMALPLGDMTDQATPGLQFGGSFGFSVAPRVTLGGEIYYSMLGLSDEYEAMVEQELGPDGDMDLSITQYGLYAKIGPGPTVASFYSKLSMGMYRAGATASLGDVEIGASETDFGLGAGVGYQFFGRGTTGGFIEADYHVILSDGGSSSYLDLKAGVTFQFL
jgi:hypothetical protein